MRPLSSNSCQALATDDWLGMVTIRIQRPSTRRALTTLNDCDPPETCITAKVRPWVGRTLPSSSGSQRSEEHTSETQSLMRISYAVFCLKKKIRGTQTSTVTKRRKVHTDT